MAEIANECPGCGGHLDETAHYEGRPHDHWEADTEPYVCGRCYVRDQKASIWREQNQGAQYGTPLWAVRDKPKQSVAVAHGGGHEAGV